MTGRFAPSPSAPLHLGNLRTALLAWCAARSTGGRFLLRVDDLTTSADHVDRDRAIADGQLADLAAIGVDHDGAVVRQSARTGAHLDALARLVGAGRTYPCACSRREIREAVAAPHGPDPDGAYPGTCRDLEPDEVERRAAAAGRTAALRLRADGEEVVVEDRLHGPVARVVDDVVLRRGDGAVAYNLAVVVDDAAAGVDQVVRGDDLLPTTPAQVLLQRLLGLPTPEYAHVPLVLGPDGERLSKRHGAVTLAELLDGGRDVPAVVGLLAASVGLAMPGERLDAATLLARFDLDALPRTPWTFHDGGGWGAGAQPPSEG